MGVATAIGRKAIRITDRIVDTTVLIVILLLIVIGCYAVWDSGQVYQAANAARYEVYRPTAANEGKSFAELQAINPDVFGWLTVYGTHIDYPVVQGPDNMTYINANAERQYSLSGAIFLDQYSSRDFSDFSSIVYGHHMEKNAMFGELGNFADKNYFDAREYGALYYDGQEHGLEFFAFVHADAYDGAVFRAKIPRDEQQAYLDMLLTMALHARDLPVTTDDRIVLLSTCSDASTNGRDLLIAKITGEPRENPFRPDEKGGGRNILTVDGLPGLWARFPAWVKWILILLPLVLPVAVTLTIKKKRRSRRARS